MHMPVYLPNDKKLPIQIGRSRRFSDRSFKSGSSFDFSCSYGCSDSFGCNKAQRYSPSYKIADCELSNSYLLTHKIFSSNRFFITWWIALSFILQFVSLVHYQLLTDHEYIIYSLSFTSSWLSRYKRICIVWLTICVIKLNWNHC